jgi:DNA-directed RNA polymerase subunit RPC12/RpoP
MQHIKNIIDAQYRVKRAELFYKIRKYICPHCSKQNVETKINHKLVRCQYCSKLVKFDK